MIRRLLAAMAIGLAAPAAAAAAGYHVIESVPGPDGGWPTAPYAAAATPGGRPTVVVPGTFRLLVVGE